MSLEKREELEPGPAPDGTQSWSETVAVSTKHQEIRCGLDVRVHVQGDLWQEVVRSVVPAACGSGPGPPDTSGSPQGAKNGGTGSMPSKVFVPTYRACGTGVWSHSRPVPFL